MARRRCARPQGRQPGGFALARRTRSHPRRRARRARRRSRRRHPRLPDVRRCLRKLLESAFPEVTVLTYTELVPELQVRPWARSPGARPGRLAWPAGGQRHGVCGGAGGEGRHARRPSLRPFRRTPLLLLRDSPSAVRKQGASRCPAARCRPAPAGGLPVDALTQLCEAPRWTDDASASPARGPGGGASAREPAPSCPRLPRPSTRLDRAAGPRPRRAGVGLAQADGEDRARVTITGAGDLHDGPAVDLPAVVAAQHQRRRRS
jgi:hypothetical protein